MPNKTFISWLLLLSIAINKTAAQQYRVTTNSNDQFSQAFINLLRCAEQKFADCRGKLLQYTVMQEHEYKLDIDFPGSAAAIVREGNWEKDAYVEYRGFVDKEDMIKGMNTLKKKIAIALGSQYYNGSSIEWASDSSFSNSSISVRDDHGYFQANIEVLSGSSADTFLLEKTNKVEKERPADYFVLIKIIGGTPAYYNFIDNNITSPEPALTQALRQLMLDAADDFKSRSVKIVNQLGKYKTRDTIKTNGINFIFDSHSSHANATINFPISGDSIDFAKRWEYYHKVIQSAAGKQYVSYKYNLSGLEYVSYFPLEYEATKPKLEMSSVNYKGLRSIQLLVKSSFSRPTKRSATYGDW